MAVIEQEILDGRRAFPKTQQLFFGVAVRRLPVRVAVGWYGTETHPEAGAFAVVREDGPYGDLVGEMLRLAVGTREVFVYCIGARGVPTDIAVTRRAFLSLGRLSLESITAVVEVVS